MNLKEKLQKELSDLITACDERINKRYHEITDIERIKEKAKLLSTDLAEKYVWIITPHTSCLFTYGRYLSFKTIRNLGDVDYRKFDAEVRILENNGNACYVCYNPLKTYNNLHDLCRYYFNSLEELRYAANEAIKNEIIKTKYLLDLAENTQIIPDSTEE